MIKGITKYLMGFYPEIVDQWLTQNPNVVEREYFKLVDAQNQGIDVAGRTMELRFLDANEAIKGCAYVPTIFVLRDLELARKNTKGRHFSHRYEPFYRWVYSYDKTLEDSLCPQLYTDQVMRKIYDSEAGIGISIRCYKCNYRGSSGHRIAAGSRSGSDLIEEAGALICKCGNVLHEYELKLSVRMGG